MTKLANAAPVLIVGAGPVGLMAATLLARQNVPSLIVERRTARATAPKAHALNPRSLEVCRSAGVDLDAIDARKTPAEESGTPRQDHQSGHGRQNPLR